MSKEMGPAFPVGNDDMWEAHEAVKAERDRLQATNAELLAALEQLMGGVRADYSDSTFGLSYQTQMRRRMIVARAAIAKAKGEK